MRASCEKGEGSRRGPEILGLLVMWVGRPKALDSPIAGLGSLKNFPRRRRFQRNYLGQKGIKSGLLTIPAGAVC